MHVLVHKQAIFMKILHARASARACNDNQPNLHKFASLNNNATGPTHTLNKLQQNPRLAVDWTMDKSKTKKQVNTNKTYTNTWKTQVDSGLGDG